MIRQIITPKDALITLRLPDAMVGKTLEVIAFEIDGVSAQQSFTTKAERLQKIDELTKNSLVDLSNFRFSRNEANNYDD